MEKTEGLDVGRRGEFKNKANKIINQTFVRSNQSRVRKFTFKLFSFPPRKNPFLFCIFQFLPPLPHPHVLQINIKEFKETQLFVDGWDIQTLMNGCKRKVFPPESVIRRTQQGAVHLSCHHSRSWVWSWNWLTGSGFDLWRFKLAQISNPWELDMDLSGTLTSRVYPSCHRRPRSDWLCSFVVKLSLLPEKVIQSLSSSECDENFD